ncbi:MULTISPECIES: hypothetical protein [Corynebacterium]|uniref:hypothetical protein n=1 Tax=Corynebacterium TaxID=1716 RepID=UPI0019585422|nr:MULTISPECIES: hypothetical protein [Corynebacterium]MDN8624010.1 hypothetical protein [Corynebacterium kroppenstedtii]QRQ64196.1 hypothetical protein I6J23_05990 [Corynebacterium kroppenstedtii]
MAMLLTAFTSGVRNIDKSGIFGAAYFSAINDGSGTYPIQFGARIYFNLIAYTRWL